MTEEVVSFSFTTKRKTVTKTNTVMLFNYLGYMKKYTENALQVHTISAVKLILKKVFNRNTVKVSYCNPKNMKSKIDKHNRKILEPVVEESAH